jgi:hypothetical protein
MPELPLIEVAATLLGLAVLLYLPRWGWLPLIVGLFALNSDLPTWVGISSMILGGLALWVHFGDPTERLRPERGQDWDQ